MAKIGRPSDYTPELADEICRRVREGESLHRIAADPEMPCEDTFYSWLKRRPDFAENYARAREARADRHFEEIFDIADGATAETVQEARLQVDARKWALARMSPRKYGDKLGLEHSGEINFAGLMAKAEAEEEG